MAVIDVMNRDDTDSDSDPIKTVCTELGKHFNEFLYPSSDDKELFPSENSVYLWEAVYGIRDVTDKESQYPTPQNFGKMCA